MNGILYGVGIGPGDPEDITLKALRIMKECDVIAFPGKLKEDCVAYKIAKGAYPEIDEKESLAVYMPMTKDPDILKASHEKAVNDVEAVLKKGLNVAFITLGDPTVYSTYMYVHSEIISRGCTANIVSGITSFCASAAAAGISLTENNQPMYVFPASYDIDGVLDLYGTKILMKSARKYPEVREKLISSHSSVIMVENCGMENQQIYRGAENLPETAGYYTMLIVKN